MTDEPIEQLTALERLIRELEARFLVKVEAALDRVAELFTSQVLAAGEPIDDADLRRIEALWLGEVPDLADELADIYLLAGNATLRRLAPGGQVRSLTEALREHHLIQATNRLSNVGDALWSEASRKLADGVREGESYDQLRDRLRDAFAEDGQFLGESRATRIARTEVQAAVNAGTLDAARLVPEEIRPRFKTWVATLDRRTRDSHFAADGQTVLLDQPFVVDGELLQYPGDPNGSAGNVINCRCTQIVRDDDTALTDAGRQFLTDEEVADVIRYYEERDVIRTQDRPEPLVAAAGNHGGGCMLALVPTEADAGRLAVDDGLAVEDLHMTLRYLGKIDELDDATAQSLRDFVRDAAGRVAGPLQAEAFGVSWFNPTGSEPAWVLQVGGQAVADAYDAITVELDGLLTGLEWQPPENHAPWAAHVTLTYSDDSDMAEEVATRVGPVTFDRLRLALGDEVVDVPLGVEPGDGEGLAADGSATHSLTETNTFSLLRQRFMDRALAATSVRAEYGWTEADAETYEAALDEALPGATFSRGAAGNNWQSWYATVGDVTLWAELDSDGSWAVNVAANDDAITEQVVEMVRARVPAAAGAVDDRVAVRFWAHGPMGPTTYGRRIETSPWDAARGNYPAALAADLDELMSMDGPPSDGGRLLIWHGPPGTGKTHALRSLANAWSSWCDVEYIIDADEFFEHASYMTATLASDEATDDRWRLVVVEDAGRYLLEDAQSQIGEGLGRLLNLADGLVGQGLKQLILMTTNEPIDRLHSAVTRPGRCLANLHFGPLPEDEANAWLEAHGVPGEVDRATTLAELYQRLRGKDTPPEPLDVKAAALAELLASDTLTEPTLTFTTARIRGATLVDIPAFIEARITLTGEPDDDGFAPWEGVIAMEDVPTGDGRMFTADSLRWENIGGAGWPLRWDIEDDGAHLGAIVVGRIDEIERSGSEIRATGVIDTTNPVGLGAFTALSRGMIGGVSVDLDDIPEDSVEVSETWTAAALGESGWPIAPEDTEWDPDEAHAELVAYATDDESGEVDVPLLAATHLWIPNDADMTDPENFRVPFALVVDGSIVVAPAGLDWALAEVNRLADDGTITADEQAEMHDILEDYFERLADADEPEVDMVDDDLEASAWGEFKRMPPLPAELFSEPDLANTNEYMHHDPATGRLWGWVAQAGVCHDAFSGTCVTAPLGSVDLRTFNRQPIELDDGTTINVGVLTMGTGHDNDGADVASVRALFDDTRTVAGIVHVGLKKDPETGEDLGLWFSGIAAPWLSEWDRRVLLACRPSGHWKRLRGGGWSLRGVLSVPVPGFPNRVAASAAVNRSNMALAASAEPIVEPDSSTGTVTVHVNTEFTHGDGADEFFRMVAAAVVDEMESRARIRAEVEALSAELSDARRALVAGA